MRTWIAGVSLLVACSSSSSSPSMEDVIARHRDEVQGTLDRVAAAHRVASDAAAATAPPSREIVLLGARAGGGANAALVHLEDLAALADRPHGDFRVAGTTALSDCASLLSRGRVGDKTQPRPSGAEDLLRRCAQVEILAVIRTAALDQPEGSIAIFTPGSVSGDVVFVELDGGAVLGGFAWEAKSSEEVRVNLTGAGVQQALERNLASQMTSSIHRGLDAAGVRTASTRARED